MKKRVLCTLLALAMVFSLVPAFEITVSAAESIPYQKPVYNTQNEPESGLLKFEEDTVTDYTVVTEDTTQFEDGKWYVVTADVTIGTAEEQKQIEVSGDAYLILKDGATLTVECPGGGHAAIGVAKNNSLTVYGQSGGTGTLTAVAGSQGAAIGGDRENGGQAGKITVNGGTVNATCSENGGAGYETLEIDQWVAHSGHGGEVIINGGTVAAFGEDGNPGIGVGKCNRGSDPGSVTVNGGLVYAVGSNEAAGIGGGDDSILPEITVTGGTVFALGGSNGNAAGAGIGSGTDRDGGSVTVSGGTVTAIGGTTGTGSYGSGIGGGTGSASQGSLTVTPASGFSVRAGTNTGCGAVKCANASDALGQKCVRIYTAQASSVPYLYWDAAQNKTVQGYTDDYEILTEDTETISYGFYLVNQNLTYGAGKNLKIDGDTHLILCDGKT